VLLFLTSFFFVSCKSVYYTAPKEIKNEFTYKYDGKETHIDSLLSINGYYIGNSYYIDDMPWHDTIYLKGNMIFFKDGMYTADILSSIYYLHRNKNISEYFCDIHRDDSLGIPNDFYERRIWGRYLLCGDTIKVQYVVRPVLYSSSSSWDARELWYKIINKDMILLVFAKPIGISKNEKRYYYERERKRKPITLLPNTFVPTKVLPSSNGWLKQEKWFWYNEEDWKRYMDSLQMEKGGKNEK
jgi:hypothetical protein